MASSSCVSFKPSFLGKKLFSVAVLSTMFGPAQRAVVNAVPIHIVSHHAPAEEQPALIEEPFDSCKFRCLNKLNKLVVRTAVCSDVKRVTVEKTNDGRCLETFECTNAHDSSATATVQCNRKYSQYFSYFDGCTHCAIRDGEDVSNEDEVNSAQLKDSLSTLFEEKARLQQEQARLREEEEARREREEEARLQQEQARREEEAAAEAQRKEDARRKREEEERREREEEERREREEEERQRQARLREEAEEEERQRQEQARLREEEEARQRQEREDSSGDVERDNPNFDETNAQLARAQRQKLRPVKDRDSQNLETSEQAAQREREQREEIAAAKYAIKIRMIKDKYRDKRSRDRLTCQDMFGCESSVNVRLVKKCLRDRVLEYEQHLGEPCSEEE